VIFLRHPKPAAATGLCYGRTDLDIAPEGEAQIAAALLAVPPVTRVIASPALRCRKLAESKRAPLKMIWQQANYEYLRLSEEERQER